jgi:RimJ/RimL family protein N-acetyltransferase
MPDIETTRLRLRMLRETDVDHFAAMFSDPEVMKFLGIEAGVTLSRMETEDILNGMIAFWKRNGFGRWAVTKIEDGRLIGLCGLRLFENVPELFYLFAKTNWGQGYATEAAAAALRYGFEELNFDRIIAVIRSGNTASLNVAEKIGMAFEKEISHLGVEGVCYVAARDQFQTDESKYRLSKLND